jgi:hypothetical protein
MSSIFERPKVTYVVLVVAIVGFFALSAVGNTGDHNTKYTWIGNIGWAMFLLSLLATVVYTIVLAIRAMRHRRTA